MAEQNPAGPLGCRGAITIAGAHYWCELAYPHPGLGHSSQEAQAIWLGHIEASEEERRKDIARWREEWGTHAFADVPTMRPATVDEDRRSRYVVGYDSEGTY